MPLFSSETDRKYAMMSLRIVGDFGAVIAVPVVGLVLIGQRLDAHYHSGPWYTTIAFIAAAAISAQLIYRKAKDYGREFQALNDEADLNKKNNAQNKE